MQNIVQKDISARAFWVLACLAVLVKVGLVHFQCIYTWIDGAPLDDELMFHAAQSITAGQWLGTYNYLTLSKHMFFPVWLSFLHALHIPYLEGGALFWCAASLCTALAFAPVLRRYKSRLLLFLLLAFSPASTAGFTLRVYRDNIFPAECMLFFAGMIGFALRVLPAASAQSTAESARPHAAGRTVLRCFFWLLLCGAGLSMAWLTREDGVWLLPFLLVGGAALALILLLQKGGLRLAQKLLRCAMLTVPVLVLAISIHLFCAVNQAWYGVYTLSDFSSGSFAAAFGAMTRVESEHWHPLVSVPEDVREKLYENVEELAPFRYWLEENDAMRNGFIRKDLDDYPTGSFYWVLRRAAQELGVYQDAPSAEQFWQTVADKINALCENGTLPAARGPRASTTPPIRAEYVPDVLSEGAYSLFYTATFQDCEAYLTELTVGLPEDVAVWEEYLGNRANLSAVVNTADPYYSPLQKIVFYIFHCIRCLYAFLLPPALLAAAAVQLRQGVWLLRSGKMGKASPAGGVSSAYNHWLLWLILIGVLCMALLRCLMIAFVEVASFGIGTYVMYLSTVHPLLILYAAAGLLTAWPPNRGTAPVSAAKE